MSWRDDLLPASFRGVPFYVSTHERVSGRRVVVSEYPLRDRVTTEDLGRAQRKFEVEGYITGEDYFADRDALISACEDSHEVGTLVHPYLGELRVRCMTVGTRERMTEGRVCTFLLGFVEAGEVRPTPLVDTRAGWLATIKTVLAVARRAFAIVNTVRSLPSGALLGWLADFGISRLGAWAGLPGLSLSTTQAMLTSVSNFASGEPDTIPDAIQAPFLGLAAAALDTSSPARSASRAGDAIGTVATTSRGEGDDPARLVGIVLLQAPAARPSDTQIDADGQAALAALDIYAYGCAIAAAALVMADTDWPNTAAANAARDTLLDAVDVVAEAAADAGQDALYAAWRAFAAAAAVDLTARAMQAPRISAYTLPRPMGSLALAHRLYQDASRADELVALNAAVHPCFLPAAGVALAA